jgi:hypothetical protein
VVTQIKRNHTTTTNHSPLYTPFFLPFADPTDAGLSAEDSQFDNPKEVMNIYKTCELGQSWLRKMKEDANAEVLLRTCKSVYEAKMRVFVSWFLWKFGGDSVTCDDDGVSSGGGSVGSGSGSYTHNPPTEEKLAQLPAEPNNLLTDANVSGYLRAVVRFGRRKKDPGHWSSSWPWPVMSGKICLKRISCEGKAKSISDNVGCFG